MSLCEIETAKSLVELPSPFAGTVTELLVEEGITVEVGTADYRRFRAAQEGDSAPATSPAQLAPVVRQQVDEVFTPDLRKALRETDNEQPASQSLGWLRSKGRRRQAPSARKRPLASAAAPARLR